MAKILFLFIKILLSLYCPYGEHQRQSAGQVVAKNTIARHALGRRIMPYDRSVDAHVSNLRKKLGPLDDGRQRIKTVRGKGYLYVTTAQ